MKTRCSRHRGTFLLTLFVWVDESFGALLCQKYKLVCTHRLYGRGRCFDQLNLRTGLFVFIVQHYSSSWHALFVVSSWDEMFMASWHGFVDGLREDEFSFGALLYRMYELFCTHNLCGRCKLFWKVSLANGFFLFMTIFARCDGRLSRFCFTSPSTFPVAWHHFAEESHARGVRIPGPTIN